MRKLYSDILKLSLGLFLYALGLVIAYEAHVGYAPWEVFHIGLSQMTKLTIGQANVLASMAIMLFVYLMKEPMGVGSLLNVVLVGLLFDLLLYMGFVPKINSPLLGILYVLIAMIVLSLATYYYVDAGFGAGPRDSFIIFLHRRYNLPIGTSRRITEIGATALGYFMGGTVGLGTLAFAFGTGYVMEFIFNLLKFDPKATQHRLLYKNSAS